jgi:D-glycero-D-manno-heptose 1,7-bisphosphate phosphatase
MGSSSARIRLQFSQRYYLRKMDVCMNPKALFIDRDGIINQDFGYVSSVADFKFTDGIFELLTCFARAGYLLVVVTNQSGIGRGYYTQSDFECLTQWMLERFSEHGLEIKDVFFCPHTPDEQCHCRKPDTGMIEAAVNIHRIDLSHSWMIGDKFSDVQLARNSGISKAIFIGEQGCEAADFAFANIQDCADYFRVGKRL